ncbi:unnamed protein product [Cyprideis torosa]|uniref:Uncharacterized protein n=1 Tax=Cyprideis torosa TaxID=163714 RepID=A0A7R8W2B1_9CRUS|nr:unnamed protein product [Cyprideis torosa]CAG0881763.1 unnamed protein product [Cyprideis torosa]
MVSLCLFSLALLSVLSTSRASPEDVEGTLSCHIEYATGYRANENVLETLSLPSAQKCSYMCLDIKTCNGFNYNKNNEFCELLGGTEPKSLVPEDQWKFYWVRNKRLHTEESSGHVQSLGGLGVGSLGGLGAMHRKVGDSGGMKFPGAKKSGLTLTGTKTYHV